MRRVSSFQELPAGSGTHAVEGGLVMRFLQVVVRVRRRVILPSAVLRDVRKVLETAVGTTIAANIDDLDCVRTAAFALMYLWDENPRGSG